MGVQYITGNGYYIRLLVYRLTRVGVPSGEGNGL